MSSILVPIDFSIPCRNAYRFALHLAAHKGLDVVLVHYYSGSIDPRTPFCIGGDGTIQGSHEARMRQLAYAKSDDFSHPPVQPPCGVRVTYETGVSLQTFAAIINRAGRAEVEALENPAYSEPFQFAIVAQPTP